jgi:hypothetical protein
MLEGKGRLRRRLFYGHRPSTVWTWLGIGWGSNGNCCTAIKGQSSQDNTCIKRYWLSAGNRFRKLNNLKMLLPYFLCDWRDAMERSSKGSSTLFCLLVISSPLPSKEIIGNPSLHCSKPIVLYSKYAINQCLPASCTDLQSTRCFFYCFLDLHE